MFIDSFLIYYFFGFLVFNGAFSVDFSVKENDGLKKYYGKRKTFFEQGIEMNINSSYTIYLEFSIRQYHMVETSSIYFYFIPSNYNKFYTPEINTEYFQQFPVVKNSKFLLDLTNTRKWYKMIIEYSYYYDDKRNSKNEFNAYGYYTDNPDIIKNTSANKIELIHDERFLKIIYAKVIF